MADPEAGVLWDLKFIPPMPAPTNNDDDLMRFNDAKQNVLGDCHMELERRGTGIHTNLPKSLDPTWPNVRTHT